MDSDGSRPTGAVFSVARGTCPVAPSVVEALQGRREVEFQGRQLAGECNVSYLSGEILRRRAGVGFGPQHRTRHELVNNQCDEDGQ